MADVISATNSDSAFDASKGVTRTNLPPFAQRLRKAADLVWEEGYRQPFIRELGEGTLPREKFAFYLLADFRYLNDYARVPCFGTGQNRRSGDHGVHAQRAERRVECGVDRAPHVSGQLRHHRRADEQRAPVGVRPARTRRTSFPSPMARVSSTFSWPCSPAPGCTRITDIVLPMNSPTRSM